MGYLWSLALFVLLFNVLYAQAQNEDTSANSTTTTTTSADGNESVGSADRDVNDLALTAPGQIEWCSTVDLTWTNGAPLYEIYYARGTGAIGDENALGAEQWLGAVNELKFSWHVTSEWTIPGDTIRLRVQDDQGHGINGTAWAAVVAGSDTSCGNPTSVGPTTTIQHSSFAVSVAPQITSKAPINNLPGENDSPEPTTTSALVATATVATTAAPTNNAPAPIATITGPLPTSDVGSGSAQGAQGGNDQSGTNREGSDPDPLNPSDPFDPSNSSNPSNSSGSGNTSGGGSPVVNHDDSPVQTGNINNNGAGSDSNAPMNSSSSDTAGSKNAHVSSTAVGAIIGSMIGALILVIAFLVWRRRKQQQSAHLRLDDGYDRPMSETEAGRAIHTRNRSPYSPFSVVTSNPPSRGNSARSNPHSHSQSHSPSNQVITPEPGSGPFADDASLMSYNAAVGPGVYSPLDTPDPFRSTTFQGQVPFLNLNQSQHQIDSSPHAL